jgi:hypothetical protein
LVVITSYITVGRKYFAVKEVYLVRLYIVQEIFEYADERSGANPKTNKQKNVVFLVILCRCAIRAINIDLRKPESGTSMMIC